MYIKGACRQAIFLCPLSINALVSAYCRHNYRYRRNKHGCIDLQLTDHHHRDLVFVELCKEGFIAGELSIIMPLIIFCLILLSHFADLLPDCATFVISRRNLLLRFGGDGM